MAPVFSMGLAAQKGGFGNHAGGERMGHPLFFWPPRIGPKKLGKNRAFFGWIRTGGAVDLGAQKKKGGYQKGTPF